MSESLYQPHDAFMKALLSEPDLARGLFSELLPESLVSLLNLDTLKPVKGSYVNSRMRRLFTDALFSVETSAGGGESCLLSLLLEHKSTASEDTAIQVLGYLYEGYRAQWKKDKKLHPIIPIVYYHGKEAWSPVTLGGMLEKCHEALRGYVPEFGMVELNLQAIPEEAILGLSDVWLRASLQVQKYSYDPEKLVDRFVQIFETLNTARGGNFFQQFGIYYFWVSKIRDEKLQELVVQLPANKKAEIMEHVESILETRERLGLEKGLEQGLEKGKREVAIKGYRNGVSIEVICLMTGYTEEELKKIVLEEEK